MLLGFPDVRSILGARQRKRAAAVKLSDEWLASASEEEKSVAAELAALCPERTDGDIVQLVQHLSAEADIMPDALFNGLNSLRQILAMLASEGGLAAYPAASEFLRLRCLTLVEATDPAPKPRARAH
jgi:hypothetical protein